MSQDHGSHSLTDILALPLQARAGLCATLRGQPGLAFQIQNIGTPRQSVVAAASFHN
jgi:hypothetical protein